MPAVPKIANIQLTKVKFNPGDRIIVRVYAKLDRQQLKKLCRTLQKWARDTEILMVDTRVFDVEIDSGRRIV